MMDKKKALLTTAVVGSALAIGLYLILNARRRKKEIALQKDIDKLEEIYNKKKA